MNHIKTSGFCTVCCIRDGYLVAQFWFADMPVPVHVHQCNHCIGPAGAKVHPLPTNVPQMLAQFWKTAHCRTQMLHQFCQWRGWNGEKWGCNVGGTWVDWKRVILNPTSDTGHNGREILHWWKNWHRWHKPMENNEEEKLPEKWHLLPHSCPV